MDFLACNARCICGVSCWEQFFTVFDQVTVALLGQEELPIGREILVTGVTGNNTVKIGEAAVNLGAKDASQTLGFFLPGAKCPGYLNGDIGVRQVNSKVCYFAYDQAFEVTAPKLFVELFSLSV